MESPLWIQVPCKVPPLSRRRPVVAIPGKGVRCQWGHFDMRASPDAPPNIEKPCKVQSVIQILWAAGWMNVKIHKQLKEIYDEICMSLVMMRKWVKQFATEEQMFTIYSVVDDCQTACHLTCATTLWFIKRRSPYADFEIVFLFASYRLQQELYTQNCP